MFLLVIVVRTLKVNKAPESALNNAPISTPPEAFQ